MKLGKTLVSFLSVGLVLSLASCGGAASESVSSSDSESASAGAQTRPWSDYEKAIQKQYLKFVMPELPVPNDETTVFKFDGEDLESGYLNLQDAINVTYTVSDEVSEKVKSTLTAEYGEPSENSGVFEWEVTAGEGDCYTAYIDLTVAEGKLSALPYTFSQKGMEYWMDNNMVKNDGTFLTEAKFADEYPGFPQLSGSDDLEAIYGACTTDTEKVFEPIVSVCNQSTTTVASMLSRLEAAGWKIYHWKRDNGTFNSRVYTKIGVSGAFITYDFGMASSNIYTFEFLSGYSAAKYGADDPSYVPSVTSSDSTVSA